MKLFSRATARREKRIQDKFHQYFDGLRQIVCRLHEALASYVDQDRSQFTELLDEINALEHRLDEDRRDIEAEIYGRRLLPDTRDDILGLLENMDKIPDRVQSVTRGLMLQNPEIPRSLSDDLRQLSDYIVEAIQILIEVTYAFLNKPVKVRDLVIQLSRVEHAADLVEQRLIALAFDAPDRELAHKMQLQALIARIGSVCDLAEDVGDRLMIASLKRAL
jgi:predicted phosphate transport protein (TIGR00153 family)